MKHSVFVAVVKENEPIAHPVAECVCGERFVGPSSSQLAYEHVRAAIREDLEQGEK